MLMPYDFFHRKCLLTLSLIQHLFGYLLIVFLMILPLDFHFLMQESLGFG